MVLVKNKNNIELHRENVYGEVSCQWCGKQKIYKGRKKHLYRFRTQSACGVEYDMLLFCSLDCRTAWVSLGELDR